MITGKCAWSALEWSRYTAKEKWWVLVTSVPSVVALSNAADGSYVQKERVRQRIEKVNEL